MSLRAFPVVDFDGDPGLTRQLVRSMLLELCVFHGPDHLELAVVTANPDSVSWQWVKWPPHAQHTGDRDGLGPSRMIYTSLAELESALAENLAQRGRFSRTIPLSQGARHLVVVLDDEVHRR